MAEQIKKPDAFDRLIANVMRLNHEAYLAGLDEDLRIAQIKLELTYLQEDQRVNLDGENPTSSETKVS